MVKASLERVRGGALDVVLEGSVSTGSRGYAVRLAAHTFVRDVVAFRRR